MKNVFRGQHLSPGLGTFTLTLISLSLLFLPTKLLPNLSYPRCSLLRMNEIRKSEEGSNDYVFGVLHIFKRSHIIVVHVKK